MSRNPNPNTKGLREFQEKRSQEKRENLYLTLEKIKQQSPNLSTIKKSDICKLAGISKTFLHNNQELNEGVDNFIKAFNKKVTYVNKSNKVSNSSKDFLISSLKRKNAKLEKENKEIKEANKTLYGRLSKRSNM